MAGQPSPVTSARDQRKSLVRVGAVALVAVVLLLLPKPGDLSEEARRALVVFGCAAALWILDAIPPALTAMLAMVTLPALGVIEFSESLNGFANRSVWLLVGVLFISVAIQKSNFDRRLALSFLRLARGNSRMMLLAAVMATLVLIVILPTSVGRAAVVTPIFIGLVRALGLKPGSNLGKSLFLAFSFISVSASVAVITGALATIYAANIFSELLNFQWTYLGWLKVMMPGAFLIAFMIWLVLVLIFPPEFRTVPGGVAYIESEIDKLGKMKPPEIRMAVMLVVLITLWLTERRTGLSISYSCLIVALVATLPVVGVVEWKDAVKAVSWNTVVLLGSVLSIAHALSVTDAFEWVSVQIFGSITTPRVTVVALMIVLLVIVMRLGFPNAFTVIAVLLPITFTVANRVGVNPVWLGMLVTGVSTLGFILPTQAVTHLTTYSSGYYSVRDMQRAGLLVTVGSVAGYFLIAYLYWPLVGLPPVP